MSQHPDNEAGGPSTRRDREPSPDRPVREPSRFAGLRFKKKARTDDAEQEGDGHFHLRAMQASTSRMPISHPFDRPRFTTASDLPDSSLVGPSIVRAAPVDPSRYHRDPLGEHRNFCWAQGLAHAFTENGTHCVTALNVPWVLQLIVGAVDISLRSDSRFGIEDPLNWPQLYSPLRPHLPFIPKCPTRQAVCAPLWLTPTPHDFLRANDDPSGEAYGYLSSRKLRDLRLIVEDLDGMVVIFQRLSPAPQTHIIDELLRLHAATRNALALFAVPSSFRNVVSLCGRLHRCWVECWALMRWYNATQRLPPSSHVRAKVPLEQGIEGCGVMGAFCTGQSVTQQLYAASVPVWYVQVRHMVGNIQTEGRQPVPFTQPVNVVQDVAIAGGDVRRRAMAGEAHLAAVAEESEALLDIEHTALPAAFGLDDEEIEAEDRGHKGKGKGKGKAAQRVLALERFKSQEHELLPARVAIWQEALSSLDLSKTCEALVGLWFPEPELLVMPQNKLRLLVYISNWVSTRTQLFALLGRLSLHPPVTQNSWRTLLSRFPEQSEEEKQASESQRTPASSSKSTARGSASGKATSSSSSQAAKKEAAQKRHQQKEAVCAYFSALFGLKERPLKLRVEPISSFVWRGTAYALDRTAAQAGRMPLPADVVQEIAWELAEVTFRVEVCELDARMVPRRGQRALRLRHELLDAVFVGGHWSKPDLPPPLKGLWAEAFSDRVECLESLRLLLLRWPSCPDVLKTQKFQPAMPVDDGLKLERAVVKLYCECAYQQFGRAAALPRIVPPSLRAV
ncbi:hypothetical protein PsYK624_169830 [Phanerochaete sordida]|uniref:Uncharacterized protein n=1 Tax=Phanerochaete sordida TaxID=48140 RepID=A0A9P3GYE7_9APHY|nr:hypothetical protein PsYK624_169830 [Phanerochaete sordida]